MRVGRGRGEAAKGEPAAGGCWLTLKQKLSSGRKNASATTAVAQTESCLALVFFLLRLEKCLWILAFSPSFLANAIVIVRVVVVVRTVVDVFRVVVVVVVALFIWPGRKRSTHLTLPATTMLR